MKVFTTIIELFTGMLILFAVGALIGRLFKLDDFFKKKKK